MCETGENKDLVVLIAGIEPGFPKVGSADLRYRNFNREHCIRDILYKDTKCKCS